MSTYREKLRRVIIRESKYLRKIFASKTKAVTNKILKNSSERQINLLFRLFNQICANNIPMRHDAHASLKKKKKLTAFSLEFNNISEKVHLPLSRKLEILTKFNFHIPSLLIPLFVQLE